MVYSEGGGKQNRLFLRNLIDVTQSNELKGGQAGIYRPAGGLLYALQKHFAVKKEKVERQDDKDGEKDECKSKFLKVVAAFARTKWTSAHP